MTCIHCMPNTLDEVLDEHTKNINKGGLLHLESLLREIEEYKYETISQVKGAVSSRIERLKGEGNE